MAAPLDPGGAWLAAGITGLARQREWDAVATADAPGTPGDEVEFVALPDGRLLVDSRPPGLDAEPLAAALADSIKAPYRGLALRRNDLWTVGASAIEVVRLDPEPSGDELELVWDGSTLGLVSDGISVDPSSAPALERIAGEREQGSYAAQAHRLDGDLFELVILPL